MTNDPAADRSPISAPITHWHAHVYYDADTFEQASKLCHLAAEQLPVQMGRLHQRPVGPHPMWSCQLTVGNDDLGQVITWLNMRRNGLIVFVHPNTGDDLTDHRDRAVWLGDSQQLKLSIFEKQ